MVQPSPHCISKASIRRLAHDVEQRLAKNSYECVIEYAEEFISKVLALSYSVASFTRKKAISKDHIAYAIRICGIDLPPELQRAELDDLKHIQRCNIRAPAQQRKRNALHAEISDASFFRVVKKMNSSSKTPCRLNVSARHFLHLVTEQHIMSFFRNRGTAKECTSQDEATAETLAQALGCSWEQGQKLAASISQILNQVPALLKLSKSRTVDGRLLQLAATVTMNMLDCSAEEVTPALVKNSTQILRGRLMNTRVTTGASKILAQIIQSRVAQGGDRMAVTA